MRTKLLFLIVILTIQNYSLKSMESNQEIIEGDCFIIPASYRTFSDESLAKQQRENLEKKFGRTFSAATGFIALWVRSEKSGNWSDHDHPAFGTNGFPSHFPIEILKNKDEGDTIEFNLSVEKKLPIDKTSWEIRKISVPVKLTCKQIGYRYQDWGTFKTVFEKYVK